MGTTRTWRARRAGATALTVGSISLVFAACGGDNERERPAEERTAPPTETAPTATDERAAAVEAGKRVFETQGCGSCHTLEAAGTTGTTGPDLDEALSGRDREFIRTSIVEPDASVEDGFPSGVMPGNYEQRLEAIELDQLVEFLFETAARD